MRALLSAFFLLVPSIAAPQEIVAASAAPAHESARDVAPPQAIAITRQILLRIDDALRSGNYTVLRDLAAPSLRDTQTSATLALLLAPLWQRKIELLAAAIVEPKFTRAVVIRDGAEMQLEGYLPTAPQQINFAFALHVVGGAWQLAELKVNLAAAEKVRKNPEGQRVKEAIRPSIP